MNTENCSNAKVLFIFLSDSDYIEPLVRNVLCKSFEIFIKDKKITNYTQLFSSVDNEILKKITE